MYVFSVFMYQVSLHIHLSMYSVVLLNSFLSLTACIEHGPHVYQRSHWQSWKIQGLNFSDRVDHSLRRFQSVEMADDPMAQVLSEDG